MNATGQTPTGSNRNQSNLDPAEVERFSRMAAEWWDPTGKFRPLHQIGPARMSFIRDRLIKHFDLPPRTLKPYQGLRILDIGCGGGLVSEPLARLGATVVGIDPSEANIRIARAHAAPQGLAIDYRMAMVEDLLSRAVPAEGAASGTTGEVFDAVVCLEVVEHVPDVGAFLRSCAALLAPGGVMIVSTINRTLKSFALAIVGAEYVLRWLPVGTHQWERFVRPEELARHLQSAGLTMGTAEGMVYNPLADRWALGRDTDVNFLVSAVKAPTRSFDVGA